LAAVPLLSEGGEKRGDEARETTIELSTSSSEDEGRDRRGF